MKLVNNEYVIELNDIINNSEIEETDLVDVFGERYKFNLAQLSKKTYQAMYSAYRGVDKERQRKVLQYMINHSDNYQTIIREAIIEYIRGAVISGMDLREYIDDSKRYPESVREILRNGGLWIIPTIEYKDEDIE